MLLLLFFTVCGFCCLLFMIVKAFRLKIAFRITYVYFCGGVCVCLVCFCVCVRV